MSTLNAEVQNNLAKYMKDYKIEDMMNGILENVLMSRSKLPARQIISYLVETYPEQTKGIVIAPLLAVETATDIVVPFSNVQKTEDVQLSDKSRTAKFLNNNQRVFLNQEFSDNVYKISLSVRFAGKMKFGFYQAEDTDINAEETKTIYNNSLTYSNSGDYYQVGWSGPKTYESIDSGAIIEWIIDFLNHVIAIKINQQDYKVIFYKIKDNCRFFIEGDKEMEVSLLGLWKNDRSLKSHVDCNEDWLWDYKFIETNPYTDDECISNKRRANFLNENVVKNATLGILPPNKAVSIVYRINKVTGILYIGGLYGKMPVSVHDYSPYFYGVTPQGDWVSPKNKTSLHPKISNGDLVEITYDQFNRRLLMSLNNKFLGVIFKDLPSERCIPCLRGSYYADIDIVQVMGTNDPPISYLS